MEVKQLKANEVGVVSPWVDFYREIEALFEKDPGVEVEFDNDEPEITIRVEDGEKAEALSKILPTVKVFGNVILKITVVPANKVEEDKAALFEAAFKGNSAFSFATTISEVLSNPITYVVFENKVVQYYNDDLGDIYGQRSTLYQELAKDVFIETDGVHFCTDKPELAMREGEE